MKAKVIAVHSFKGGTGKTTLTANLASTLALDHRVGVMDLDLSGPGLHVLFGLRKGDIKATLTDIFLGDASPNEVVIDLSRKYGLTKGGLFFCPASNKVEDMLRLLKSGLEVSVFQDILQKVGESKNLDYIIVDTHPGVENDTVMALLAETFEKPTYLALNMVPPGVKIKDAVKVGRELADLFKSKFLEAFEFQIDVINNLSRSVFILDNPNSTFARKVDDAADYLVKELGEAPKIAN